MKGEECPCDGIAGHERRTDGEEGEGGYIHGANIPSIDRGTSPDTSSPFRNIQRIWVLVTSMRGTLTMLTLPPWMDAPESAPERGKTAIS